MKRSGLFILGVGIGYILVAILNLFGVYQISKSQIITLSLVALLLSLVEFIDISIKFILEYVLLYIMSSIVKMYLFMVGKNKKLRILIDIFSWLKILWDKIIKSNETKISFLIFLITPIILVVGFGTNILFSNKIIDLSTYISIGFFLINMFFKEHNQYFKDRLLDRFDKVKKEMNEYLED